MDLDWTEEQQVPAPSKAPTVGEHRDDVLRRVLGYEAARIAKLREGGAIG